MTFLPFGLDSVFTSKLGDLTLGSLFGAFFFTVIGVFLFLYVCSWIYALITVK